MMITFCKKNVYSFLYNIINTKDQGTVVYCSPIQHRNIYVPANEGLSFLTILKTQPSVNVVGSAAIKPLLSPFSSKRDPGGIGFLDEVGGLMSCTESLGFESSDERRADDLTAEDFRPTFSSRSRRNHDNVKREVKKFPPPLSSLDYNGKPTFFLRPVRTNGRLELTEVKIHRPEILHASRQDGRLRLDFIVDEEVQTIEDEDNGIEEVNGLPRLDFKVDDDIEIIENQNEEKKEEIIEEMIEESEEEKEETGVDQWKFPVKSGGGSESSRRCHELSHRVRGSHHPHSLHVWSQPCVTIR